MTTLRRKAQRANDWYVDVDGIDTIEKVYESSILYTFDWAAWLDTKGLTISSVTWVANGVAVSSETNTTTTFTAVIGQIGEAVVTVVLSNGDSEVVTLRWRESPVRRDDYGAYHHGH